MCRAYLVSTGKPLLGVGFLDFREIMQKKIYNEPFLSYEDQITLLKKRGMSFKNENQSLDILKRVSYYRLSGYWYIFLDLKQGKIFKENTDFDKVFELYEFDASLRKIILAELGNIEAAVRSRIVDTMSLSYGSFWLEQNNLFSDFKEYTKTIVKIIGEIDRSKEKFITSFKGEYSNEIPPAFMVMEIISFGTLSRLYKNLRLPKDKQEISQFFGLSGRIFGSWLHSLSYVRNICAHHARLWNKKLGISTKDYKSQEINNVWLENGTNNERIYMILSIIIYLLNTINKEYSRSFKQELKNLFQKHPNVNTFYMGFPKDWQTEPLWA